MSSLFCFESALLAQNPPDVLITNSLVHNYNTRKANKKRLVPQQNSTLAISKSPYHSVSVNIYNSLPRILTQETRLVLINIMMQLIEFLCEAAF